MIKIGIGGMAGAGKSTLRDMFKKSGAFTVNLDEAAHDFYSDSQSEVYKKIKASFESRIQGLIDNDTGAINRKKLGAFVFNNASALDELNAIFYKSFIEYIESVINLALCRGYKLFVLDAAVLFAGGLDSLMDYNIYVSASMEVLINRLVSGRGIERDYAEDILNTQLKSYHGYENKADFIIYNDGETGLLELEYVKVLKEIQKDVDKN